MQAGELRQLYLADLALHVKMEGKEFRKVKNIGDWRKIKAKAKNGFIDFTGKNIFVWSDQHFGHRNIIRYCDRPFEDQFEMNAHLILNYQRTVEENDICIFGGDVSMMNSNSTNELLARLPGYKILIVGNHDLKKGEVLPYNFDEILPCLRYKEFLFTHYPLTKVPEGYINVHGHIHNKPSPTERHRNVSVERINYTPRRLEEL